MWEWKLLKIAKYTHRFFQEGSGNPKKLQKALSQEKEKRVHFLETDNFHSRKPNLRECKRPKNKKYAPALQKPDSVKPTKSRNTLPPSKVEGVEKSEN